MSSIIHRNPGLSLIEVVFALAISSLVLVGVVKASSSGRVYFNRVKATSDILDSINLLRIAVGGTKRHNLETDQNCQFLSISTIPLSTSGPFPQMLTTSLVDFKIAGSNAPLIKVGDYGGFSIDALELWQLTPIYYSWNAVSVIEIRVKTTLKTDERIKSSLHRVSGFAQVDRNSRRIIGCNPEDFGVSAANALLSNFFGSGI